MPICEQIKSYIRDQGLKQRVIAERAGFKEKTFNHALNGKRKLKIDEFLRICDVIGVDPAIFLKRPTKTS